MIISYRRGIFSFWEINVNKMTRVLSERKTYEKRIEGDGSQEDIGVENISSRRKSNCSGSEVVTGRFVQGIVRRTM